jgi:peptide/nickel transport system substrate-binding protein
VERQHASGWKVLVRGTIAACAAACAAGYLASGVLARSPSPATAAAATSTVTVGWPAQIQTLDPDLAYDYVSTAALHLIGGNLFQLEPNGKLTDGLATSWYVSPSGRTWSFRLRSGAKFSNGAPVTAADVKATFDRARLDKNNAAAGLFTPIVNVQAPKPNTVVISLNRAYPSFRTILAEPSFVVFPKSGIANSKSFLDAPVSAGEYELKSWGGGPQATFVVNPHYYGTKPAVTTVQFTTIADPSARISQLESGQIDFAFNVPPTLLAQLKGQGGITTTVVPTYGFAGLSMNNTDSSLSNVNVRRAISLAIDRNQINSTVWDGLALPLAGFWPQTMTGYDKTIPTAANATKAKALLSGTPCANGCTLQLIYDTASAWKAPTALIIQSDLQKIGITVNLVALDFGTYISDAFGGKFQLALGYLADYANVPDGLGAYGLLGMPGGENSFFSKYTSSAMTAAVTKAVTSGGKQRVSALASINKLFVQDAPYANLFDYSYVVASRLPKSVVSLDAGGFIDLDARSSK